MVVLLLVVAGVLLSVPAVYLMLSLGITLRGVGLLPVDARTTFDTLSRISLEELDEPIA